jgi:hypothetical protein
LAKSVADPFASSDRYACLLPAASIKEGSDVFCSHMLDTDRSGEDADVVYILNSNGHHRDQELVRLPLSGIGPNGTGPPPHLRVFGPDGREAKHQVPAPFLCRRIA